jgi:Transposase
MLKTLHVGIDVSHHRHDVCVLDEAGAPLGKPFAITNNRPGAQELIARLVAVADGYQQIQVGLEATGI